MSFSSLVERTDSRRFMLCRITPKKQLVTPTVVSPNVYQYTLDSSYQVAETRVNGALYSHTRTSTTVTVTCADYDLTNSDNIVVAHYLVYLTATKAVVTSGISGLPDATWEPYLQGYPTITQSMKNILNGVFSISAADIRVILIDNNFKRAFNTDESLGNASVTIWSCIDSPENYKLVFEGAIADATISESVANLSVQDSFLNLVKTASFQGYLKSYIYNGSLLANSPDIGTGSKAAPIVFGKSSPITYKKGYTRAQLAEPYTSMYHATGGLPIYKDQGTPIFDSPAKYFVARFIGTDLAKMTFGTVTRCYKHVVEGINANGLKSYQIFYYIQCSNFTNGMVGDMVIDTGAGAWSGKAWICRDKAVTGPDSQVYQLVVTVNEINFISATVPASGLVSNPVLTDNVYYSISIFRNGPDQVSFESFPNSGSPTAIFTNDHGRYLYDPSNTVKFRVVSDGTLYGLPVSKLYVDFYASTATAVFNDNLGLSDLDLTSVQVRFSPNQTVLHGDLVSFLLQAAGLTPNAASITQANTDLVRAVSVTFPLDGGDEFSNILDCLEYVVQSTFGYLSLNDSREIEYKLVRDPSLETATGTRDNSLIVKSSAISRIEYQDVISNVQFSNPQYVTIDSFDMTGAASTEERPTAQWLHGRQKLKLYKHCLSDAPRTDAIAGFLSEPTVDISLTTASIDLGTRIGDIIEVTSGAVCNDTDTVKALVVDINSSTSQTQIKLNEIRGI